MLTTRILAALSACCLYATAALAVDPPASQDAGAARVDVLPPVLGVTEKQASHTLSGLALDGFDPVSYFLGEAPAGGRADHQMLWGGVAWRFASAANLAAFRSDPYVYAPRLGGHAADGMLRGQLADAEPAIFIVRSSGLYLFRDQASRLRFLSDETLFDKAEAAWSAAQTTIVTR